MKTRRNSSALAALCAPLCLLACGAEGSMDEFENETETEFGTVELALTGQGTLGGDFELDNATFTITGQVNRTVSGEPDTITESLPIGVYQVTLEPGWVLNRVTMSGSQAATATLASSNPQDFVVNGAELTSVSWLFNVSGPNPNADDFEVVAVTNGTLELLLEGGELGFANFATGDNHSCGISLLGSLKCWGNNSQGQLGYGDLVSTVTPPEANVDVGESRTVKRVVASSTGHTCALLDDDTIKCWGVNSSGQLGYGDTTRRTSPPGPVVNLGSSNTAKTIAVGDAHTCAILDTNALKCWGSNTQGQLGIGSTTTQLAPLANPIDLGPGNAAKSVVAGTLHTCAILADDTVNCWGQNSFGQLGIGSTTRALTPANVNLGEGRTAQRLAAGDNHTCAILDDDTVKCWGLNSGAQLGYGDTSNRLSPPAGIVNLGQGRTAKLIAAGASHTCAVLDDDTIKCWGINSSGQLGYEDTNQRSAPPALTVNLGSGGIPTRLLASDNHTCVLMQDNGIKCWGSNSSGVFGTGATGNIGDQLNEMGARLAEVLP